MTDELPIDFGKPENLVLGRPGATHCSHGLYKKTFPAGSHVALATSAVDYVVLVR